MPAPGKTMNDVVELVRKELRDNADETARLGGERYFRESVLLYGVNAPLVESLARKYFHEISARPKQEIFSLCEELWQSGFVEDSLVACSWSHALRKQFVPGDMAVFERWIDRYVTNWAACDTLCNHTVGALVEMYPRQLDSLKRWAASSNRWMRRAAAVSLIIPARHGLYLAEELEIAAVLLRDEDDMVRKGYGWMLKVAAGSHLHEVFDFVMHNKAAMPRTALRYAIEKMPADMKARAMEKPAAPA